MKKEQMEPRTFDLISAIASTIVCGRNREAKLQWLIDLITMLATLIIEFLRTFDAETIREIKLKLQHANYSRDIAVKMEAWHPKGDWEPFIKMLVDLVISLLHRFSPDDPDPIPPAPTPDSELGEYTEQYIRQHIDDPQKQTAAAELADGIDAALKLMTTNPPETVQDARAVVRASTHAVMPSPLDQWLTLSQYLADHIELLNEVAGGLSIADCLALWARIAEGARNASK